MRMYYINYAVTLFMRDVPTYLAMENEHFCLMEKVLG